MENGNKIHPITVFTETKSNNAGTGTSNKTKVWPTWATILLKEWVDDTTVAATVLIGPPDLEKFGKSELIKCFCEYDF